MKTEQQQGTEVVKQSKFSADLKNQETMMNLLAMIASAGGMNCQTGKYSLLKQLRCQITDDTPTKIQQDIKIKLDSLISVHTNIENIIIGNNVFFDTDQETYMIMNGNLKSIFAPPLFRQELKKLAEGLDEVEILCREEIKHRGIIHVKEKILSIDK